MAKWIIEPKGLPRTMGPYSQIVEGQGSRLVFISGQVPVDASGNLVGPGDLESQTRQVLKNLKTAVEAAGGRVGDICKITIFLVKYDEAAYRTVAQARKEFFEGEYPASTLVQVVRLASPDWLIEIEAYAVI
ncbi:MAG: RidA family protein [Thermodesulfobacteriota bacterium]